MLLCVKDGHTPYQLNTIPEITNNNCILQKKTTLKKLQYNNSPILFCSGVILYVLGGTELLETAGFVYAGRFVAQRYMSVKVRHTYLYISPERWSQSFDEWQIEAKE